MATITLDQADLVNADKFLTQYLSEKVPDADFNEGSVVRDFMVTAIAFVFAYLEKERKITRDQQSLLALAKQAESEDVSDAVNALLSNWFITRKTGLQGRVTATLHFSAPSDVTLTPTTRFYRTSGLVFVPDLTSGTVISAASLTPVFDASGVIVDYTATISLVAANSGTAYNMPPGRFVQADQFNPYFTYAENTSTVQGGRDTESTAELLARAPTAISVRNLVNARSIDTVLRDTFSGLTRVLSVGFGDPEMLRDYSTEAVTRLQMHLGGHTDIYVQLPVLQVVETGFIGIPAKRPDNVIATLKDDTVDFVSLGIQAGDILKINAGLSDVPREYILTGVTTNTLAVSPRAAFAEATDETVPTTTVEYTVGRFAPNYDDLFVSGATNNGMTSRTITYAGRYTLQGRPHYRISKVEVYDSTIVPASAATVYELQRTNLAPGSLEYRLVTLNVGNAQSAYAVDQIEVNTAQFPGTVWAIRVTYDTLSGYSDVQNYVTDRFQRVLASNPLVKGYHPVYVGMSIGYRVKLGATAAVNEDAVKQAVAAYINEFDLTRTLDLTGVIQHMRDSFPDIGVIVGVPSLYYSLYAPDGQVYEYATKDIVSIYPDYPNNNAQLTNGTALADPVLNADVDPTLPGNEALLDAANTEIKNQLKQLGVSDRTLVFLTTPEDISLSLVL